MKKIHIVYLLIFGLSLSQFSSANDEVNTDKEAEKTSEGNSFFSNLFKKKTDDEDQEKILPLKYPVEIVTNDSQIKAMIEKHLPLITSQQQEVLDKAQIEFLVEDAPEDVKTMLKTEGYFNSKVNIVNQNNGYIVNIELGPQTKIDNLGVAIVGDILNDPDLPQYYKNAFDNWSLPIGDVFNQGEWSSSKSSVLFAVRRKKYPLAKISTSKAIINPDTNTADLSLLVESSNPIYFGDFEVTGTKRYPESVVTGLAQFKPGSQYDLDQLLSYQQALEQDGHYSGAAVQADFENLQGDRVPIKVNVTEVKLHKLDLSVRYDSAYGLGGRVGYDYYNLFNKGYVGSFVVDKDKYDTIVSAGISQPRDSEGKYWTTSVSYRPSRTQNLKTKGVNGGIWHVKNYGGIETRLGVEYYLETSRKIVNSDEDFGRSYATMLTASWKRQNIETALHPQNGYYLDGKIGASLGSFLSSTFVAQAKGRAGYFYTPENKKIGTFIARGEFGYTYSKDDKIIPAPLQYRTGGVSSIRGYEVDSIGLNSINDSVLPENALAVLSFEYQYPITKSIAGAVFHDMGDVSKNFKSMKIHHGTGVGVRWFSPIAPLAFDIAYGHSDKKIRWNISLGTRF